MRTTYKQPIIADQVERVYEGFPQEEPAKLMYPFGRHRRSHAWATRDR